jgi:hypothetical protein
MFFETMNFMPFSLLDIENLRKYAIWDLKSLYVLVFLWRAIYLSDFGFFGFILSLIPDEKSEHGKLDHHYASLLKLSTKQVSVLGLREAWKVGNFIS